MCPNSPLETSQPPMTWIEESAPSLTPGKVVSTDRERDLPLAGLSMVSRVLEGICDTEMVQRFENPYQEVLEAVYIFPLPGAAAVYAFELRVGERVVSGQVQERGAARAAYQQALEQGHRAAIMEQERDDVFTLQVGNLPPGENVEIRLSFCQTLDYREEGLYELRLPMVVPPRYIPGAPKEGAPTGVGVESDTAVVPDASRITPPRLAPGFDPRVDLQISVEWLNAGEGLSRIACSQHATQTELMSGCLRIELARDDERLNRDFVLRWQAGAEALRQRMYYVKGPDTDYGLLQLSAPAAGALLQNRRDVIFLLDRSGSMGDYKMASAAQACALLLDSLGPRDRYAVLAFDDRMEWFAPEQIWQPADEAGRARGQRFLKQIESRGGTEMFTAIQQALKQIQGRTGDAQTPILVILTDGEVGDESRILRAIQQELGEAVVYTVGIDTAVNESFLSRLARLGGGTSVSVAPGEKLAAALKQIAGEIGYPALWQLATNLPEALPQPLPDLYLGRSQSILFSGTLPAEPRLTAQSPTGAVRMHLQAKEADFPALPRLWAKARIQALEDAFRIADADAREPLRQQMIALSVEHQLLCRFTAWLAVDEAEVVAGSGQRVQQVQPVEMPALWQAGAAPPMPGAMPPPPVMFAPPGVLPPSTMPQPMGAPIPASPAPQRSRKLSAKKAQAAFGQTGMLAGGGASAAGDKGAEVFSTAGFKHQMEENLPVQFDADESFHESAADQGSGFFDKLKQWVAPPRPQQPAPAQAAKPLPADTELAEASTAFLQALETALQQLETQQQPELAELQHLREALIELLSHSAEAERRPALQRLLRQESQRLLKALETGSFDGLAPLIERCRARLKQVRSENAETQTEPFWAAGI